MKRILLVDDDPLFSQFVSATMKVTGDECNTIDDGNLITEVDLTQVDHVLVDLNIPGMDGLQVLRYLKEEGFSAHVSILSGTDKSILNSARQVAAGYGLRVKSVLQKPFPVEELINTITTSESEIAEYPVPFNNRSSDNGVNECDNELMYEALRGAIESRSIDVFFQPKVSLTNGRLIGFEQLARWTNDGQFIPPDVFISLAEQHALIDDLTKLVVEKGLESFSHALKLCSALTLSINISAKSLPDKHLPDYLNIQCQRFGILPEQITLELTETSLVSDDMDSLQVLTRLRVIGFGLSIDDFGTGYSSISQLQKIPFTELKIDRSFIIKFVNEHQSQAIVNSTINMANRLGLDIVAEGIEDQETVDALVHNGCLFGQGYFYAKPMASDALLEWLARLPESKRPLGECDNCQVKVAAFTDNEMAFYDDIDHLSLMDIVFHQSASLETQAQQWDDIRLVLIDNRMTSIDPFELAREIKQRHPHAVTLLLCDDISQTVLTSATRAGIDDTVKLPVDAGELIARLRGASKHTQRRDKVATMSTKPANLSLTQTDYVRIVDKLMVDLIEASQPESFAKVVCSHLEQLGCTITVCLKNCSPKLCFSGDALMSNETEYQVFELFKDTVGVTSLGDVFLFNNRNAAIMVKDINASSIPWTEERQLFLEHVTAIIDIELSCREGSTFNVLPDACRVSQQERLREMRQAIYNVIRCIKMQSNDNESNADVAKQLNEISNELHIYDSVMKVFSNKYVD